VRNRKPLLDNHPVPPDFAKASSFARSFGGQVVGQAGTDRFFLPHFRHFVPGYSQESLRDNSSPGDNNYVSANGLKAWAIDLQPLRGKYNGLSANFFFGLPPFSRQTLSSQKRLSCSAHSFRARPLEGIAEGWLTLTVSDTPDGKA
jgi:hypothetical protein